MIKVTKVTTQEQLEKECSIRKEVFVKEQNVPLEDEFDEYDHLTSSCEHILIEVDGNAAGTGRIRFVDGFGKLERICILIPYRKLGIGKLIVNELEKIAKEKGCTKVKLHGQTQARGFYEKLGYEVGSEEFMEDGIPHYLMVKHFEGC